MALPRTGAEIRAAFLSFFQDRGHQCLPSDSLVPSNDPTLLFTGAGMNQFKDEFLGRGRLGLKRATTAQKCLRVPDLENVGRTPRHHTFFEMLGNFSFGDYFKAETIPWEWTFFTEVLGWDGSRFVATVYQDDDEAFAIWTDTVGIAPERVYRFGEKENFWPASAPSKGPNGVCGPCSEIYFDLQPEAGSLPARAGLSELPDRFLEVGNFVFTQFDRQDGGVLTPLPQKNIDVGLGLERIAAVAQGAPNNFETDLFAPLLDRIQSASGRRYGGDAGDDIRMRRIADHARATFFCIADGAAPSREGRGYVVRKILRRAVRDGIELGIESPFLVDLLPAVLEVMGAAFPELAEQRGTIEALAQGEEERFREVYRRGIVRLEAELAQAGGARGIFPGEVVFELHDTYGFPADIAEVIVREHGFEYDAAGFERAMNEQRDRARSGSAISGDVFAKSLEVRLRELGAAPTKFVGWDQDAASAKVLAVLRDGELVTELPAGEEGELVLDTTPFYAEGGGQVGDCGTLAVEGRAVFGVTATRAEGAFHVHQGKALATVAQGDAVDAQVDTELRRPCEAHHTGTHLLHAALKQVLGAHVNQAGSQVAPERLRFDYTQPEAPTREQLEAVEALVNQQTLASLPVQKRFTTLAAAKAEGVTALFGEKYSAEVRVVEVPGFSLELCGGTHVLNTGAIGPFRILSDRALAAGVRRIEAVAGRAALASFGRDRERLRELEVLLKAPADRLAERVNALKEDLKAARSAKRSALPSADDLVAGLSAQAADPAGLAGGSFAWTRVEDLDAAGLRSLSDKLQKHPGLPPVVLIAGGEGESLPFVIFVREPGGNLHAGRLAKAFGQLLGGGGGGRPDFAQGQASVAGADLKAAVEQLAESLPAAAR
ncbi:MAG TPA: alanine--tRNA ligase [Planctomycetota bacterium]